MTSKNLARSEIQELLSAARDHFREGGYQIAEPMLQQLVLADGTNPEIFHMLATIYYDQGKFNKAIRTFRRALEIDPTYTDASVGLSIILNDIGRYEEGRQVFADAQAALSRKSRNSDSALNEKLASKHDEIGDMYFQHKRIDDAIDQYNRALALTSRKADLRMKLVECAIQRGDGARAVKDLRLLAQDFPNFTPARLKLGLLLFNSKKIAEALEQWEAVLLRDPDHPIAVRYVQMARQASRQTSTQLR